MIMDQESDLIKQLRDVANKLERMQKTTKQMKFRKQPDIERLEKYAPELLKVAKWAVFIIRRDAPQLCDCYQFERLQETVAKALGVPNYP